jgi:tRNA modification GTPase
VNRALDTVACCLTPPGRAGLACLALHGPRAWEVLAERFRLRSGKPMARPPEVGFWLGHLGGEEQEEVVLVAREMQPTPYLEVHCHGGPEVVRYLLELVAGVGVKVISWEAFLPRLAPSPTRALALRYLSRAPTVRTAEILLGQASGVLDQALSAVVSCLASGDIGESEHLLSDLLSRGKLGLHLCEPWRVVVAGPANVGKSSLVNALAGYQRSVVSPTPGTTRDVLSTHLALDGWPVEVIDTAGLRDQGEGLEAEGMHWARAEARRADLCLWLVDVSQPPVWPDAEMRIERVVNKIDLPRAWDAEQAGGAVEVSAKTGQGLAELCAALSRWLVPAPPAPDQAVPFTAELIRDLEQAQRHLSSGQTGQAQMLLARWRAPLECGDRSPHAQGGQ